MEKVRIALLAGIFGSVFCVLVRTILLPATGKTTTPFVFPAAVPLPEWQLKSSRAVAAPMTTSPSYLSGQHYRYIQNHLTLDIEMRYLVKTRGDVRSLIKNYSSLPPSPSQLSLVSRQQKGIGFYSLFAFQQRAYLSSCINSRGGSTVTVSQFRHNRYIYDSIYNMRFKEDLIPWLQGRRSIQDTRCLWAHLSIPLKNSVPEDAYQILEKAWFSWYQWWHPRFPQP